MTGTVITLDNSGISNHVYGIYFPYKHEYVSLE